MQKDLRRKSKQTTFHAFLRPLDTTVLGMQPSMSGCMSTHVELSKCIQIKMAIYQMWIKIKDFCRLISHFLFNVLSYIKKNGFVIV